MYKVFFNDRTVFLNTPTPAKMPDNIKITFVSSMPELNAAWSYFRDNEQIRQLYLSAPETFDIASCFASLFTNMDAAGGLVENRQNQLLCIFRWGIWDLPKGKVEHNESFDKAALREVEEECGIHGHMIKHFLQTTHHIYLLKHKKREEWVLKHTHWFAMDYFNGENLMPQTLEDIEKAEWFSKTEISTVINNTYASLKSLITDWATLS